MDCLIQMNEVRISSYDPSIEITLRLSPFVLSCRLVGSGSLPARKSETAGYTSFAFCLLPVTRFCRLGQWQMFGLSPVRIQMEGEDGGSTGREAAA
jgi:hypothetical protein